MTTRILGSTSYRNPMRIECAELLCDELAVFSVVSRIRCQFYSFRQFVIKSLEAPKSPSLGTTRRHAKKTKFELAVGFGIVRSGVSGIRKRARSTRRENASGLRAVSRRHPHQPRVTGAGTHTGTKPALAALNGEGSTTETEPD